MTNKVELSDEELKKASGGINMGGPMMFLTLENYSYVEDYEFYINSSELSDASEVVYVYNSQAITCLKCYAHVFDDLFSIDVSQLPSDMFYTSQNDFKQKYPYHLKNDNHSHHNGMF